MKLSPLAWVTVLLASCGSNRGTLLPNENIEPVDAGAFALVARIAHISDSQIIDTASPARLPFAGELVRGAWRPYEMYSTQLLDGMVRAINRYHASGLNFDFVVHTGDAVDNAQWNELNWFLTVMDGGEVTPLSGPDDRADEERPEAELDPYAPFQAEGLYRQGVHGDRTSIPWYLVMGNHDQLALGNFPIVPSLFGGWVAPLPLTNRIGIFLPRVLEPTSGLAYGPISPGHPEPFDGVTFPSVIDSNSDRRFVLGDEYREILFETESTPEGHGYRSPSQDGIYSTCPVPGLRLIGVNSSNLPLPQPGLIYSEGSVGWFDVWDLVAELEEACGAGERVIIMTHHPSESLSPFYGSALDGNGWRELLRSFPCVDLHLVGHSHVHRVWDQGNYWEIETGSTLDFPQEGRFIEVWESEDAVEIRYWMFSHLDECGRDIDCGDEPIPDDPLRTLREAAFDEAQRYDKVFTGLLKLIETSESESDGADSLVGVLRKSKSR